MAWVEREVPGFDSQSNRFFRILNKFLEKSCLNNTNLHQNSSSFTITNISPIENQNPLLFTRSRAKINTLNRPLHAYQLPDRKESSSNDGLCGWRLRLPPSRSEPQFDRPMRAFLLVSSEIIIHIQQSRVLAVVAGGKKIYFALSGGALIRACLGIGSDRGRLEEFTLVRGRAYYALLTLDPGQGLSDPRFWRFFYVRSTRVFYIQFTVLVTRLVSRFRTLRKSTRE